MQSVRQRFFYKTLYEESSGLIDTGDSSIVNSPILRKKLGLQAGSSAIVALDSSEILNPS